MARTTVFADITVVTTKENGQTAVIPQQWVTVTGKKIASVEDKASFQKRQLPEDAELYDGRNRILLSALANCHGHMPMTLMRNSADDLGLERWLNESIFPREAKLTPQIVATGSRLALVEMIKGGIGAAADMYYFATETAQAALDAGFRLNFAVDVAKENNNGQILLDYTALENAIARYDRKDCDLLRVSMLVHSVYLYEEEYYKPLADLAVALACPLHIHVAETETEVTQCLSKYGQRPAAQLARFGFFSTPTLAAHCVHLDDEERKILAEHQVFAVHCPASNLKLGSGIADVAAMLAAGVKVVLGTDGAASNNNLDLYRDMRLAALLAKGSRQDASLLTAGEILPLATAQGMRAMGFSNSGRIARGWDADLQIVRTDGPGMTPLGDPVSALVYSAAAADVESLMVAGRWLMKKRELLTIDEEKVRFESEQAAGKLSFD